MKRVQIVGVVFVSWLALNCGYCLGRLIERIEATR